MTAEGTPDQGPDPAAPFDPWRLGAAPAVVETPRRKPNKLMADLTKAMQTAAESARDETLARLQADAKAHVETIHARSATEAEELRHTADADIASIREWSKAEIARIREETDQKVTDRKSLLETETEEHAARIERRIERVQAHVAWFEQEMATFFERLLAEEDPTHLAAMAENLPEPPAFDDLEELPEPPARASVETVEVVEGVVEESTDPAGEPFEGNAPETAEGWTEPVAEGWTEPVAEGENAQSVEGENDAEAGQAGDPEAAFAAIQAAAEAGEAVDAGQSSEADPETAPAEDAASEFVPDADDPRLSALGLSPEAAAEAEAEAEVNPAADGAEIESFSDDALAARLAGLVPGEGDGAPGEQRSTRVVVTGLVSVASIASFKRHLGRLDGVASVGVSSGPDGEFIFAVNHDPAVNLAEAVTSLPGFAAEVTSTAEDTVSVAARDPETES